jgi:predicted ATP-dependent endonuclease of OLD family
MKYQLIGKNFQSWDQFDLQGEGFTAIIGPSDIGKSAIIRALMGVLRNQVSQNHIREGTKEVAVQFDMDGSSVLLKRSTSTTYSVNGVEFAKLAGEVPPPVSALKMNSVEANGVKLDPIFSGQFDKQFMLSMSPAELTSVLSLFSNTERLSYGKKTAGQRGRELDAQIKLMASEIQQAEEKKSKLTDVQFEADRLGALIEGYVNRVNTIALAHTLMVSALIAKEKIRRIAEGTEFSLPSTQRLQDLWAQGRSLRYFEKKQELLDLIRTIIKIDLDPSKLYRLLNQASAVSGALKVQKQITQLSSAMRFNFVPIDNSPLHGLQSFNELNGSIKQKNKTIRELVAGIEILEAELSTLKKTGVVCPKCSYQFEV